MIYAVFLTIFLLHQSFIYGEQNRFNPVLEVSNEEHDQFLKIINEQFEEGKDKYFFSCVDSGYRCEINNVTVVFQNSSEGIIQLFNKSNEDVLRKAIDEYKTNFFITLDRISPPVKSPFKLINANPQRYLLNYVKDFRKEFFDLHFDGPLPGPYSENNYFTKKQLNHYNGLKYQSPENDDGGKSDLSESTALGNSEGAETSQTASHYSYSSQSMRIYNYKNDDGEQYTSEGNSLSMSKEKALDILYANTVLRLSGACSKVETEQTNPSITFNASISRNAYSATSNVNNGRHLRSADIDGYANALDNGNQMNETLKGIIELVKNAFGNQAFLKDFLPQEALSTLDQVPTEGANSESDDLEEVDNLEGDNPEGDNPEGDNPEGDNPEGDDSKGNN